MGQAFTKNVSLVNIDVQPALPSTERPAILPTTVNDNRIELPPGTVVQDLVPVNLNSTSNVQNVMNNTVDRNSSFMELLRGVDIDEITERF